VVVKGEHCGKYVRRIHHRYHEDNGNKQAFIILAVVEKVDGAADTLTGEQFELGPDSLCLAFETNEDKKLNANLMTSLREDARQRRSSVLADDKKRKNSKPTDQRLWWQKWDDAEAMRLCTGVNP
jgi:hypothetical protein